MDKMKVDKLEFRFSTTTAQGRTLFICSMESVSKTDAPHITQYKFLTDLFTKSPLCANVDALYDT